MVDEEGQVVIEEGRAAEEIGETSVGTAEGLSSASSDAHRGRGCVDDTAAKTVTTRPSLLHGRNHAAR